MWALYWLVNAVLWIVQYGFSRRILNPQADTWGWAEILYDRETLRGAVLIAASILVLVAGGRIARALLPTSRDEARQARRGMLRVGVIVASVTSLVAGLATLVVSVTYPLFSLYAEGKDAALQAVLNCIAVAVVLFGAVWVGRRTASSFEGDDG